VRTRPWLLLAAGWVVLLICLGNRVASSPPAASSRLRFLGAGSCAAAACHGNQESAGNPGTEYATWAARDRHARSFATLFKQRSTAIMTNLGRKNAHEDKLCLHCHVHPHFDDAASRAPDYFMRDGVSCESCHGPGAQWLPEHYKNSWKALSREEKRGLGMRDTKALADRIRICLDCHVGSPEADVNHDLIAAGHPRLNFEFAAFHASWPRHWPDRRDKDPRAGGQADFEAQAWALAQLLTAKAALDLLRARAEDQHRPWPEFAELDCYACHQVLRNKSRLQAKGNAPWSQWYFRQLPHALSALRNQDAAGIEEGLAKIGRLMAGGGDKKKIAELARETGARLTIVPKDRLNPLPLHEVFQAIVTEERRQPSQRWDEAAQVYLSLAALHNAWTDQNNLAPAAKLRPVLVDWRQILRFPDGFDSPRSFDPAALARRLQQFQEQPP
jgi:hypothetical protein